MLKETTTGASVGTGLARPLSATPINTTAHEFYGRFGRISHAALAGAFKDFIKARKITQEDAVLLQDTLVKGYGLLGLQQKILFESIK